MLYQLFAPAKINLDLHITGVRPDGYHTLRSHVAFADCGDDIILEITPVLSSSCHIDIVGTFAWQLENLDPADNLAVKAVQKFSEAYGFTFAAKISLTKNLPSGAGMGGGSADAAAVLRALVKHFDIDDSTVKFQNLCRDLGADVPVCYLATPCLMEGIGESLSAWEMRDTAALLIWPGQGGSTKTLYKAYDTNPTDHPINDFQPLAIHFCPAIQDALAWLNSQPGCHQSALTGSGTAVYGLFDTPPLISIKPEFPWIRSSLIGVVKKPLVTTANSR